MGGASPPPPPLQPCRCTICYVRRLLDEDKAKQAAEDAALALAIERRLAQTLA